MLDKIRNLPRITKIIIFVVTLVLWYILMTKVLDTDSASDSGSNIKTGWIISGVVIAIFYQLLFPAKKS